MHRHSGGFVLGTFFVVIGLIGLAVNFGYVRLSVELVALAPLTLGLLILLSAFPANKPALLPALIFMFVSIPLYMTLHGMDMGKWWPLWILAPGVAFLCTSILGGSLVYLAIPGSIITITGFFFLTEAWLNIEFELVVSLGLIGLGALLLLRRQTPSA